MNFKGYSQYREAIGAPLPIVTAITEDMVEVGRQDGTVGDFRRCHSCRQGYWVQALNRTEFIQCPACGTLQERKVSHA